MDKLKENEYLLWDAVGNRFLTKEEFAGMLIGVDLASGDDRTVETTGLVYDGVVIDRGFKIYPTKKG